MSANPHHRLFGTIIAALLLLSACGESPAQTAAQSSGAEPATNVVGGEVTREQSLDADLDEAIDMLQQKKHLILYYDFLPVGPMAMDLARGGNPQDQLRDLPPEFSAGLLAQLTAAKTGEKTFNRSRTLVQIEYIIKPAEHIPPKPPEGLPAMATKPFGDISGLGGNLPEVVTSAIKLLEDDNIERFVRAMYPIPELARLTNRNETQRFLYRFSSNPEMKAAMIRDLTLVLQMKAQQNGNVSVFTLPPLTRGDEERTVKFELVGTDWRFFDSAAETRPTHMELMQTPVSGYTVPGSAGLLLLKWHADEECWKLVTFPAIVPVGGSERNEQRLRAVPYPR